MDWKGYYTLKEVCAMTTLSRMTVYRLRRRGEFVESEPLSPGRIGFEKAAVHAWMAARKNSE